VSLGALGDGHVLGHSPSPSQLLEKHSALELKLSSLLQAYEQLIEKERIRVPPVDSSATPPPVTFTPPPPQALSPAFPPANGDAPADPASAATPAQLLSPGSASAALLAALPSSRVRGGHSRSLSAAVRPSNDGEGGRSLLHSGARGGGGGDAGGLVSPSGSSRVDLQWRRLSRLNSLLVSAKAKLSDAASFEELQKHAAELAKEGLVLDEEEEADESA